MTRPISILALGLALAGGLAAGARPADPKQENQPPATTARIQGEKKMKYLRLTPNLVVKDVAASMNFYQTVLGFDKGMTVPEKPPYIFGSVTSGPLEIFFNDQKAIAKDDPALGAAKIGGALTLYIEVENIEQVLQAVQKAGAKITMPLTTQFYGMREFGFIDPEGWMVTIAERVK